ncbi:VWA domain-containing protein [Sulfitobacter pseudonitzschiae]|nr:VWA domain-containing protein [Pseudosulfitobacter pseudonitzschiae]
MRSLVTAGLIALTSALAPAALAQERPSTILVLDASGSMWGQIDGINKITIARDVVGDIVSDFPADQNLGFVTYGHRERGQCADIETLVEPAPGTAAEIAGIVEGLNPRGMTPMTDAVVTAAQALRHTEQAATVILVSDGIETCNPDPCAAARALEEAGVDFTAHVIGFDVRGEADALLQMQCIAEETGGRFLTADNAQELNEALREVTAAPASGSFTFTANLGGEEIGDETVWERPAAPLELPLLSGEVIWEISDTSFNMVQTGTANPFTTDLPFGEYIVTVHSTAQDDFSQTEASLALDSARNVHAIFPPITSQPPAAQVFGPAQTLVGSAFTVSWEGEGLAPRDYVTIVPADAEDGAYADYDRLENRTEGELRAPAEPGLYEVRLQLDVGDRVLARTPVEVVDAEVAVSAPAQVVVGSAFPVTWQGEGLHPRDYVTIVPAGSADGTYADYDRMQGRSEGELRAPAEPGLYEVRLQLDVGDRVLARTPVEVMDGNVSLDGPDRARAGAEITLSWTGAIHPRDYIAIVPRGTPDGEQSGYRRIQDEDQATFTAPAEPGAYEIRYHLDRGDRVMARRPLEVLAADAPIDEGAGLMVPGTARPGDIVTVSWTIEAGDADRRVALARADAPDFTWITVHHVGDETETVIKLPDEPGQYEVRFLDLQSQSVLGRAMITLDE